VYNDRKLKGQTHVLQKGNSSYTECDTGHVTQA